MRERLKIAQQLDLKLTGCLALALGWAWINRFVQDDAFISFRYARHAAEGYGLVWNVGERVEGYTNFLWTVCLVPAYWLGVDIISYTYALSLAAFGCSLVFSYLVAAHWWQGRRAGYFAIFILGVNYSFSCYGTGGLETQFVTAWVMGAILSLTQWRVSGSGRALVGAALLSACAVMTRMDAVLLLLPFWWWVSGVTYRRFGSGMNGTFWCAVFVGATPVVLWLLWRHHYYGAWVPNTFLIKCADLSLIRGGYYVGLFYLTYGFWLVLPFVWRRVKDVLNSELGRTIVMACLLWTIYVIAVGGDFMEFRLMIPSFPLLAVMLAGMISGSPQRWKQVTALGLVGLFSILQGFDVWPQPHAGLQTIRGLSAFQKEWQEVSCLLNRSLGEERAHVKVAVTAAGTIPYYMGCWTLDLLGLNDRQVALEGESVPPGGLLGVCPGHVKIASSRQVRERDVNLVLNHPWVVSGLRGFVDSPKTIIDRWCYAAVPGCTHSTRVCFRSDSSEGAAPRVVVWPFGDGRYLITLYLLSSPYVDNAIRRTGAVILGE